MAKTFWSFFAVYDGEIKCHGCKKVQDPPEILDKHENDCPHREEALKWFEQLKKKITPST